MSKKSLRSSKYQEDNRPVHIVQLRNTYKNQPPDNKGRYIHVGANHIDDYDKNRHIAIADLVTVSLTDLPTKELLPWDYDNYCLGAANIKEPLEIKKHPGSVSINGTPQPRTLYIGSPDPSHTW